MPDGVSVRDDRVSKKQTVKSYVRKFWYVLLLVILVIVTFVYIVLSHFSNEQDWQKATKLYETADYAKINELIGDKKAPNDDERLSMYAQTMHATGNLDKALVGYQKLDEKNPSPDMKIRIANIYNQKKQYDKAIQLYRDIVNQNPSYIQAYVNLATVQRLKGDNDGAAATASKGVENNPDSVVLHELRVSMLMEDKSTKEYKSAVKDLKRLDPKNQLIKILNEA